MSNEDLIQKIEEAIRIKSELQDLEFKKAYDCAPDDIWKSISSFANNKDGGYIVLGVNEVNNFSIDGCNNIQGIQNTINEICANKMNYGIRASIKILKLNQRDIICVYIPQCKKENMPCFYRSVGPFGGSYIRVGNTSRKMTDDEVRSHISNSKDFSYDKTEAPDLKLNDLDTDKIRTFLNFTDDKTKRGVGNEISNELLRNIGLINLFDEEYKPTFAGALIFSKNLPYINPYNRFEIKCIKYDGDSPASDVIEHLEIFDTVDKQIDKAYEFVKANTRNGFEIIDTKRVERHLYPLKAIRELVANAVIHRDYKITGTYGQIRIFKNRIEFVSPGSLPPGVTVDNIKDSQFSRNEIIAKVLKDLDYLEEFGRGIDLVYREMEKHNLPEPIFKNETNTFEAILLGESFSSINSRQRKIVELLLLKGRITKEDCVQVLGVSGESVASIANDLRKLKESGIIIQKGASVSTYYILGI